MENESQNNSEYFLKKIPDFENEKKDNNTLESIDRLNIPIKKIELDESGNIDIKSESYRMQLSYKPVSPELYKKIEEQIHIGTKKVHAEKLDDIDSWKQINAIKIYSADRQKVIDLFKIMPEYCDVFIAPSEEQINATYLFELKSILILGGELTAPITIITILHEIGHAWDIFNLKNGLSNEVKQGENADRAEILRKERVANAFVLKSVRSFTKHGDKLRDDTIVFIENEALKSYYLKAKKCIEKREAMHATTSHASKNHGNNEQVLEEIAK